MYKFKFITLLQQPYLAYEPHRNLYRDFSLSH